MNQPLPMKKRLEVGDEIEVFRGPLFPNSVDVVARVTSTIAVTRDGWWKLNRRIHPGDYVYQYGKPSHVGPTFRYRVSDQSGGEGGPKDGTRDERDGEAGAPNT